MERKAGYEIMSKIGNYIVEMQENAPEMTYEEFVCQYGPHNARVWEDENEEFLMEIVD